MSWKAHKSKWSNCKECSLCEGRKRTVLFKGKIPCDVLFVGEAPGTSENMLGKPFVGPAGKLLHGRIEATLSSELRLGFTNIISCIPLDASGQKTHTPPAKAIKACKQRLEDLIRLTKPQAIMRVGAIAEKHLALDYLKEEFGVQAVFSMLHPASVLRAEMFQRGLMVQRMDFALEELNDSFIPF